jgi:hypothetical protein
LLLCGDERASELRDHRRIGTVGALVLVDEIARRSEHVEHRREVHGVMLTASRLLPAPVGRPAFVVARE